MCCSAPSFSQFSSSQIRFFFVTVHFRREPPVRCIFCLTHRTFLPQLFCAVPICFPAPHTFSAAFLCGACLLFRTAHILRSFSVRCLFAFPHRTHSPQLFCAVPVRIFAPHISSTAFMYGAFLNFRTVHFLHISSIRCLFSFPHRTIPEKSPQIQLKKHFAREMLRASGIAKQLSTIPRAAQPFGAFIYHRKALPMIYKSSSQKISLSEEPYTSIFH